MIGLGTTLRCNLPPRHIWVVLSDPARTGGDILMVNLTTLTEDCVDDVCVLRPTDYPLLTHATTVAYSRAQAGPVSALEAQVQQGSFSIITPLPAAALREVVQGAQISRQLSEAKKRLVCPT
jgi:hypothetical protein